MVKDGLVDVRASGDYDGSFSSLIDSKSLRLLGCYGSVGMINQGNCILTEYLLDEDIWDLFCDHDVGDFAVGGPTLDLFVGWYNLVTPGTKIEIDRFSDEGCRARFVGGEFAAQLSLNVGGNFINPRNAGWSNAGGWPIATPMYTRSNYSWMDKDMIGWGFEGYGLLETADQRRIQERGPVQRQVFPSVRLH